jgi:peptidoglycan-N-acetylglucosamine deacetylase
MSDVALALSFDVDGPCAWLAAGTKSKRDLSRGEFTAVGLQRILTLLDDFDARATFYVPGHTALLFAPLIQTLVDRGHEVGHHGWMHENPAELPRDQQRQVLERGLEALERTGAGRPIGYRAPYFDLNDDTVELLIEHGFAYDSSLMGHDIEPYWVRIGDDTPFDGPFRPGQPTEIIEVPVTWHLDDFPLFEFALSPVASVQGLRSPSAVEEIWRGDFDFVMAEGTGTLVLTMHPEVIGRGHRLMMLRSFLEYARAGGAAFRTCAEVASAYRERNKPDLPYGMTGLV